MDVPSYAKVEDNSLWIIDSIGQWHKVLEQKSNESDENLFERWKEQKIEEMTQNALDAEQQRINNIISWIGPVVIFALAFLAYSFFG